MAPRRQCGYSAQCVTAIQQPVLGKKMSHFQVFAGFVCGFVAKIRRTWGTWGLVPVSVKTEASLIRIVQFVTPWTKPADRTPLRRRSLKVDSRETHRPTPPLSKVKRVTRLNASHDLSGLIRLILGSVSHCPRRGIGADPLDREEWLSPGRFLGCGKALRRARHT